MGKRKRISGIEMFVGLLLSNIFCVLAALFILDIRLWEFWFFLGLAVVPAALLTWAHVKAPIE
jgi:uncharacterized membrane protein